VTLTTLCALVYTYERRYRGPDESFFIGTWRGEIDSLSKNRIAFRFKADHTYEESFVSAEDSEIWALPGRWYAGGDFLYLRIPRDDGGDPYSVLQAWHVDSMNSQEVRMQADGLHATLKRAE
jgi:hypothetical protein